MPALRVQIPQVTRVLPELAGEVICQSTTHEGKGEHYTVVQYFHRVGWTVPATAHVAAVIRANDPIQSFQTRGSTYVLPVDLAIPVAEGDAAPFAGEDPLVPRGSFPSGHQFCFVFQSLAVFGCINTDFCK